MPGVAVAGTSAEWWYAPATRSRRQRSARASPLLSRPSRPGIFHRRPCPHRVVVVDRAERGSHRLNPRSARWRSRSNARSVPVRLVEDLATRHHREEGERVRKGEGGVRFYAKTACMAAREELASRWNWSRSHRRWIRFSCIFMDRLAAYPERNPPTTVPTTGRIRVPTPAPTIP